MKMMSESESGRRMGNDQPRKNKTNRTHLLSGGLAAAARGGREQEHKPIVSGRTIVLTADPGARHPPPPFPQPYGVCRCERVSQLQDNSDDNNHTEAHTYTHRRRHTLRYTHTCTHKGEKGRQEILQEKIEGEKGPSPLEAHAKISLTHPFPNTPPPLSRTRQHQCQHQHQKMVFGALSWK